jgi:hypothetical protein
VPGRLRRRAASDRGGSLRYGSAQAQARADRAVFRQMMARTRGVVGYAAPRFVGWGILMALALVAPYLLAKNVDLLTDPLIRRDVLGRGGVYQFLFLIQSVSAQAGPNPGPEDDGDHAQALDRG